MRFTARNARYLRISAHTVLPIYIYLDDKHIEWMTDYTLQGVLEDLRPVIGPKLRAENHLQYSGGSAKKGTLDVHRGDTYQFAYFFRKTEPHAVLIKSRNFVPSPSLTQSSKAPAVEPPQPPKPGARKRNGVEFKSSSTKAAPRMRTKSRKRARLSDSDEDETLEESGDGATFESARGGSVRRSLRRRTLMAGGYRETEGDRDDIMMDDSDYSAAEMDQDTTEGISGNNLPTMVQNIQDDTTVPDSEPNFSQVFDTEMEAEEEKPKLSMRVTYQGFTIYDRCLCVIIEPWPALGDKSRLRSVTPSIARDWINPSELRELTPMVSVRERTPLFLPDLDPRRSTTPAPVSSRFFPPAPLVNDNNDAEPEDEDNTDEGGMMAFSQVLKSAGDERAGSADEADEGDVFLGDADERRGDL